MAKQAEHGAAAAITAEAWARWREQQQRYREQGGRQVGPVYHPPGHAGCHDCERRP